MLEIHERLLRQKREVENILAERFVERDLLRKMKRWLNSDIIKIVSGVRRSGKSFLAIHSVKNVPFAYVNFDDEMLCEAKFDEILKHLRAIHGDFKLLILDEIQNVDRWELVVNRLKREGYNLVITGSNANLLSKELATHLTGRYVEFTLYPFSFLEYLRARNVKLNVEVAEDVGDLLHHLEDYMKSGGFPEVVIKNYDPQEYLNTLLKAILLKDIVNRYRPKYPSHISNLAYYLLSNISHRVSFSRLKNILNVGSVHTVEKYCNYLQEAFIFFFLRPFSYKISEQLKSPRKVYCVDTGFIRSSGFRFSENFGKFMENIVFLELVKKFRCNLELFYYHDVARQYEIDFLVKSDLRVRQLIQVTRASAFDEINHREIRALLHAYDVLKEHKPELLVITWDYEDTREIRWFGRSGKIRFVPLWKWLLGIG